MSLVYDHAKIICFLCFFDATMFDFLKKIFGSRNERLLKQYSRTVRRINELEPAISLLSDEELRDKTTELKARHTAGETLEDLLPEAFAVVREAGKRVLDLRHFDVQLIGGMALHHGKIAEMRTGEGKTLVATLPAYLNALSGKGVHIVTVNDYLAKRDAEWMGGVYRALGLSVGVILSRMDHADKQAAYASDITYGTNNEFGFDYLRDNMTYSVGDRMQRPLSFAIVDEVDSILIDEARTPLIISGQTDDHTDMYVRMSQVVAMLKRAPEEKAPGDYWVDEKARQVHFSEEGHEHAEQILVNMGLLSDGRSLYEAGNIVLMHYLNAALRAHTLFHKDQHYMVQNDEIIIVDEITGRMMPGRRWSDGLHQAVEAKEGVPIQSENQTLASTTFQNFFRLYAKLAGMTGTADTEAYEFHQIYGLETVVIPTHRLMIREDYNDMVYKTAAEKHRALIADVKDCHKRGQPVLLGTTSIEASELLSDLLNKERLPHQVLNAKQHAREAEIVAQAGSPGVITIATNMAGRGTDIVLGGNISKHIEALKADESISDSEKEKRLEKMKSDWQELHDRVIAAGGLRIIASERHESRRIDNQLRGRSGRQGDPGSSRFYLSLDDPLMRIFAGERLRGIMDRLKFPEDEAIEHQLVNRTLESAQRKVEARNFDIRKQLLEYDDVANDQRKVIYAQRNELLESEDISETVTAMRHDVLAELFRQFVPEESVEEQWEIPALERALASDFLLEVPVGKWLVENKDMTDDEILMRIIEMSDEIYEEKAEAVGAEIFRQFERSIMLQSLDTHWREHLSALDHLRQGIHLRSYAQKNPKQEYKREAFNLFGNLLDTVRREVTRVLVMVQIRSQEDAMQATRPEKVGNVQYHHASYDEALGKPEQDMPQRPFHATPRPGRNDPCACGSGKKYKHCHGRLA